MVVQKMNLTIVQYIFFIYKQQQPSNRVFIVFVLFSRLRYSVLPFYYGIKNFIFSTPHLHGRHVWVLGHWLGFKHGVGLVAAGGDHQEPGE